MAGVPKGLVVRAGGIGSVKSPLPTIKLGTIRTFKASETVALPVVPPPGQSGCTSYPHSTDPKLQSGTSPFHIVPNTSAVLARASDVFGKDLEHPVGSGFTSLLAHFSELPDSTGVLFRRENWIVMGALAAKIVGIPNISIAHNFWGYAIGHQHPLFNDINTLSGDARVVTDALYIMAYGLSTYYRLDTVQASMPVDLKLRIGSQLAEEGDPSFINSPLKAIEGFLASARTAMQLIHEELPRLSQSRVLIGSSRSPQPMSLGKEFEVVPPDAGPDVLKVRVSRDDLMNSLAKALQALTSKSGDLRYAVYDAVMDPNPRFEAKLMDRNTADKWPFVFKVDYFRVNGHLFIAESLRGTGANIVTLWQVNPATGLVVYKTDVQVKEYINANGQKVRASTVFDCADTVTDLLRQRLNMSSEEFQEAKAAGRVQQEVKDMLFIKGPDNDIANILVEFDYDKKVATLTLMNGRFHQDLSHLQQIHLPELPAKHKQDPHRYYLEDVVIPTFAEAISGKMFAYKHDRIKSFSLAPMGALQDMFRWDVTNDAHPIAELVSGVSGYRHLPMILDSVKALRQLGWRGTADIPIKDGEIQYDRLQGDHTHIGISVKTPDGRWTARPMIKMIGAMEKLASVFRHLIPSSPSRGGFNQGTASEVHELINDPTFNPENPKHILLFARRVALLNPQKYTGVNIDNALAFLLESMCADGVFEIGKIHRVTWKGKVRQFRIERHAHTDENGKTDFYHQIYALTPERHTTQTGQTVYEVPVIRVVKPVQKPTAEYRSPDIILSRQLQKFLITLSLSVASRYAHYHMATEEVKPKP